MEFDEPPTITLLVSGVSDALTHCEVTSSVFVGTLIRKSTLWLGLFAPLGE